MPVRKHKQPQVAATGKQGQPDPVSQSDIGHSPGRADDQARPVRAAEVEARTVETQAARTIKCRPRSRLQRDRESAEQG